jgi:hypothetical protein
MSRPHRAKYLVLCGSNEAPRALLFNDAYQYLTEMIEEDGFILDRLLKAGRACALPLASLLKSLPPLKGVGSVNLRCYALE